MLIDIFLIEMSKSEDKSRGNVYFIAHLTTCLSEL